MTCLRIASTKSFTKRLTTCENRYGFFLLLATNSLSINGILYDLDSDGDANDEQDILLRTMANDVFSAINEQGDI